MRAGCGFAMAAESHHEMRERMRAAVRRAAVGVGRLRTVSGISLVALLCASALAPLVAPGMALAPEAAAGLGVAGGVGAEVLGHVLTQALEALRGGKHEQPPTEDAITEAIAASLEAAMNSADDTGAELRQAASELLQRLGATQAVVEQVVHSGEQTRTQVIEGLVSLGERFAEFGLLREDIRRATLQILDSQDELRGDVRTQIKLLREQGLVLGQILEQVWRTGHAALHGAASQSVWPGCPYVGLLPFTQREAQVFYGRRELTRRLRQALVERLTAGGLLLVTGPSGAGKSSLLQAGLVPQLSQDVLADGSSRWPCRVLKPTDRPLHALAACLADVAEQDPEAMLATLSLTPRRAAHLAMDAVRAACGPAGSSVAARLVLIVDQFEELFTLAGRDPDARSERSRFIEALDAMATTPTGPHGRPAALVVVSVRGDFLDQAFVHPALARAQEAGAFTVGPMTEAELREAIAGPLAEARLHIDTDLIDQVVTDARDRPDAMALGNGALPLMSQAMATTWENREDDRLTLRAYRRAGGLADVVNLSADAAYQQLDERQRAMAKPLFVNLTKVTADVGVVRRRGTRAELYQVVGQSAPDVDAVIEVFASRRLLVLEGDSVEISHDAVLSAWRDLHGWLGEDRVDRALYGQVKADGDAWEQHQRASRYLYRPERVPEIDAAVARWAKDPERYTPVPPTTVAFLAAGRQAARRTRLIRRTAIAALSVLTVSSLAVGEVAFLAEQTAVEQQHIAISRGLIAQAEAARDRQPQQALRLGIAAERIYPGPEASASLADTLRNTRYEHTLTSHTGAVDAVAFSPDRHTLASGSDDSSVVMWDATDPIQAHERRPPVADDADYSSAVQSVAFSPDGHTLAAGSEDGTATLWDATDPTHLRKLGTPLNGNIDKVAFSPVGHMLATGSDTTVILWDLADPAHPRRLSAPLAANTIAVGALAFSPNGRTLATGTWVDTVMLWDVTDAAHPRQLGMPLTGHTGAVEAVAFSPDGRTLASGGDDKQVILWNIANATHARRLGSALTGHTDAVKAVAFGLDGHTLATRSDGRNLVLWDITDPNHPRTVGSYSSDRLGTVDALAFSPDGHTLASGSDYDLTLWDATDPTHLRSLSSPSAGRDPFAGALAFSPDGHTLAMGSLDHTVILWDTTDPAHPRRLGLPLVGHTGAVHVAAFSPDGHILATGSEDKTVILWDAVHPRELGLPLVGHTGPVHSVTFSPDGRTLASGSADKTVMLWDVTDPAQPRKLGILADQFDAVAFSPDGHLLATGSVDGNVILWDIADPAHPRQLGAPLATYGGVVAFSPDWHILATRGAADNVILWDITDLANPRKLGAPLTGHTDAVGTVAFSPDGHTLATGSADTTVILWDVTDPAHSLKLGAPLGGHAGAVRAVAFSRDGRTLASGSEDKTVILWDASSDPAHRGELGTPLNSHTFTVRTVAFSPDGRTLAADGGARAVVWDTSDPTHPRELGWPTSDNYMNGVAFSPDGHTLAGGWCDNTVVLWDVADPSHPRKPTPKPIDLGGGFRINPISSLPHICSTTLKSVPGPGGVPQLLELPVNNVNAVAFSPVGHTLAGGSEDKTVILWDATDPSDPKRLGALTGHAGAVEAVAFSPDGRTVASGSSSGDVILWDVTDLAHPRKLSAPLAGDSSGVHAVAFSHDGRTLASGNGNGGVILWDVTDPVHPRRWGSPLTGHTGAVAFSPDGHILATGAGDDTAALWDVTDPAHPRKWGSPLTGHTLPVDAVAFSPDGHTLVTGSQDHSVILWDVRDLADLRHDLVARACERVERGLNRDEWSQFLLGVTFQQTCS